MPLKLLALSLLLLMILPACHAPRDEHADGTPFNTEYAERFSIQHTAAGTLVDVILSESLTLHYLLHTAADGQPRAEATSTPGVQSLYAPLNKVVCLSSTHIALLDKLHATNKLCGVTSRDFIYNPQIIAAVDAGKIAEVGPDDLHFEQLVAMAPDVIFQSTGSLPGSQMERLQSLGLPVVAVPAHYETHPLGRLEWIKLFGVLIGQEAVADSVYRHARDQYQAIVAKARSVSARPQVITGYYSNGAWVAPGGNSYFARMLKDAGADYVWADNIDSGNIHVSMEEALQKGVEADFFINIQMRYKTLPQVLDEIPEVTSFKSVAAHAVYMNNAQVNAHGKNNYWEQGLVEPDVVLMDLAHIFHPALFASDSLVYFRP